MSRSFETGSGLFKGLVDLWTAHIKIACEHKQEVWGQYADECWDFYDGDYAHVFDDMSVKESRFFSGDQEAPIPKMTFKPVINKAAEFEQLYAPMIYQKNPVPIIRPREIAPIDPANLGASNIMIMQMLEMESQQRRAQMELRGKLMESYIKYSADELDMRGNTRLTLTEGLVKGRGVMWFEIYQGPSQQQRIAGAFFDSVDNLIIDPDATQFMGASWIARKRVMPWWSVEKRFGLPYKSMKKYAKAESYNQRAKGTRDTFNKTRRKMGDTCDMVTWWEVYSKMGVGDRFKGPLSDSYDEFAETYASDYVYLAVCEGCPFFLNLPEEVISAGPMLTQDIADRLAWPIPYWGDGGWPCEVLDFHPHPTMAWPTPHMKPALGELYWLQWCASFLMEHSVKSARQFIAVAEDSHELLSKALEKGMNWDVIPIPNLNGKSINDYVQWLKSPDISSELIKIYNLVSAAFDKRTGLLDLAYGQTENQLRSAQEANIKSEAMNVRPNDMAEKMENFMKKVHKGIAMAARWFLVPQVDIAPVMGQYHAMLWEQLIYSADIETVVRELDYTIESGSARKPNLAREQDQATQALQIILPIAQTIYAQTGDPQLINAVLGHWARSQEIDQSRFVVPPGISPQMMLGAGAGMPPAA
jgi:hypothetical protein